MVRTLFAALLLAVAGAGLSACGHKAEPVAQDADAGAQTKTAKRVKNVYHK